MVAVTLPFGFGFRRRPGGSSPGELRVVGIRRADRDEAEHTRRKAESSSLSLSLEELLPPSYTAIGGELDGDRKEDAVDEERD